MSANRIDFKCTVIWTYLGDQFPAEIVNGEKVTATIARALLIKLNTNVCLKRYVNEIVLQVNI